MKPFDVCVRGAGVVGRSLALALAQQGLQVALLMPELDKKNVADVRAFALNAASRALLKNLKIWDALPAQAVTAVHEMSVLGDDMGEPLRFSAWQQGVDALAWITDAALLEQTLMDAVRYSPHITVVSKEPPAMLVALCEGRQSDTRETLGVDFERHDTGQWALAARLVADAHHQHTAHQWFGAPDVLGLLPLDAVQAERSWAMVWSLPQARAQHLMQLPVSEFEAQLVQATAQRCGNLTLASAVTAWPLQHGLARTWVGSASPPVAASASSGPPWGQVNLGSDPAIDLRGWALVGDCAHVIHPLAGQGLNLGLADVAALGEVLAERERWRSVGDVKLLRRYARRREVPTLLMGQVTDGLLQLFSSDDTLARRLRNQGMGWFNRATPLKRWFTSHAMGSSTKESQS